MSEITGREPNIVACMSPAEQAKQLAAERRAIGKREKVEQKLFRSWLELQRGAGNLRYVNPFSHKPSTIEEGHPDFSIWLKGGQTVLIEMKAEGGTLSPAQKQAALEFNALGHPVFIAWNHVQAINIVQLHLSVSVTSREIHDYTTSRATELDQAIGQA